MKWSHNDRDRSDNKMADEADVNRTDRSNELYERNALGNIASQLYPGYGEFFAIPLESNHEFFELLSAFVKHDRDSFEYVGSLRKNGGILTAGTTDLLQILRPHLHSSSKKNVDRYLIALKPPFTRRVNEFLVDEFAGRPEGKLFSWIDLGTTQIEYVDPVKLTARISRLRVDQELPRLSGETAIYVVCKVWSKQIFCNAPINVKREGGGGTGRATHGNFF